MFIFDPFDAYFRSPTGALTAYNGLQLRIKLRRGETFGAWVCWQADGGEMQKTPMEFQGVSGSYDIYGCELEFKTPGLYWYHFLIQTVHDGCLTVPEKGADNAFQITVYGDVQPTRDWIRGGVIYHIFVDRFRRSDRSYALRPGAIYRTDWGGCPTFRPDEQGIVHNNDFFGGNLDGIIEKLPYLAELGVTCIYLSPIFDAASNHKYDTGDYMAIDPAFGGDEAFARLCAAAKERGIRIVLDGVFNHVGVDSRYFNRYGNYDSVGAYQSRESPYFDWFHFQEWPDKYDSWWGIELLPAVNEQNPAYIDYICGPDGVIAHWTKQGVSGWRLDVVDELPDAFLNPLCDAMRRENSDTFIAGEVWEDASNKIAYGVRRRYFLGGQLDSVTNYPLKNAIIAYVKHGDTAQLAGVMDMLCQNYPEHVLHGLMNVLGSHDTMRILTVLGGAHLPQTKEEMAHYKLDEAQLQTAKRKLKQASLLQYTLPGTPCLYYGDEAGMEGGDDPFCRYCYPWGEEDHDLIAWYVNLAKLRRDHPALGDGRYELKQARNGVFAFTRGQGSGQILVAVNVSDSDVSLTVDGFDYDLLGSESVDRLVVKAGGLAVLGVG